MDKVKTVNTFEIGRTYRCVAIDAWISSDSQNKEASRFLDDNLEIYLDPEKYVRSTYNHGVHIEHIATEYSVFIEYKDKGFFTLVEPPANSSEELHPLSEQSIAEAIKTLSQASQELQTSVSVNSEGELTIYSNYHEKDLTFNLDSLDQLVQYIGCVKQLDSFGES